MAEELGFRAVERLRGTLTAEPVVGQRLLRGCPNLACRMIDSKLRGNQGLFGGFIQGSVNEFRASGLSAKDWTSEGKFKDGDIKPFTKQSPKVSCGSQSFERSFSRKLAPLRGSSKADRVVRFQTAERSYHVTGQVSPRPYGRSKQSSIDDKGLKRTYPQLVEEYSTWQTKTEKSARESLISTCEIPKPTNSSSR